MRGLGRERAARDRIGRRLVGARVVLERTLAAQAAGSAWADAEAVAYLRGRLAAAEAAEAAACAAEARGLPLGLVLEAAEAAGRAALQVPQGGAQVLAWLGR
jgi:hypothetical protein